MAAGRALNGAGRAATPTNGAGLTGNDFRRVAAQGFGDPQNSYAFSMAWFDAGLYVGTVRNMLALVRTAPPPEPAGMDPWPVPIPDDAFALDLRAQIWRYRPATSRWDRVYVSPMIRGPDGIRTPRDIGYRCMAVVGGRADNTGLYVATASSNSRGRGAHILRYRPGGRTVAASRPGFGDQAVSTFRTLVAYGGRLYSAPTGKGRAWNAAERPCVFESREPASGSWQPVSEPGFGDPSNDAVYALAAFNGHLYAGTLNPDEGYQIWKAVPRGRPPYRWRQVVGFGAYRGPLNEAAMTMCVFGDALYVGSGISNGGYDRTYGVGPGAPELLRIFPDDSWEVVVGTARQTPEGLKQPLSGMGPGFDNPLSGYLWSMAVHDGWLYAGTFDATIFALWADPRRQPLERQISLRLGGVDDLVEERAGGELWRSRNGVDWSPVTRNGFGNPYNYGIRTMMSTPAGLFVGTANPFGPEVAVRFADGWRYTANPDGGAEVWLGSPSAVPEPPGRPIEIQPAPSPNGALPTGNGPPPATTDGVVPGYVGWWGRGARTTRQACEHLMDELLALLSDDTGAVLDVGCRNGASTQYLSRHHRTSQVIGVCTTEQQLRACRARVPGSRFVLMDPSALRFVDASFDAIVSVEAAYQFDTRDRFFAEAFRVLRPGGRLVLADLLLSWQAEVISPSFVPTNHVASPYAYRVLLRRAGFAEVVVGDVTPQTWGRAHVRRLRSPPVRHYLLAAARKDTT